VRVELFVDPACLWSWLTSRWLVEVAPKRGLEVRWRPYSLLLRDGPDRLEDWKAAVWGASLRAVRVMQALDRGDPDGVRRFYEAGGAGAVTAPAAAAQGPGVAMVSNGSKTTDVWLAPPAPNLRSGDGPKGAGGGPMDEATMARVQQFAERALAGQALPRSRGTRCSGSA